MIKSLKAGPYFENIDPRARLADTDAIFVDAIHTDASPLLQIGLGISQPVGHVDFYPKFVYIAFKYIQLHHKQIFLFLIYACSKVFYP